MKSNYIHYKGVGWKYFSIRHYLQQWLSSWLHTGQKFKWKVKNVHTRKLWKHYEENFFDKIVAIFS